MKTTIRLIACGLALLVPAGVAPGEPKPAAERVAGRVLVLENERTLEGDIRREGEDYRVRRKVGEVWVPGSRVLRLCKDWHDAYAYLCTRANLGDVDERVRLARWCQLHGLKKEALAEVNEAVRLQPRNPDVLRLQKLLRRAAQAKSAPPAGARRPGPIPPETLPAVDLNSESISLFATRVQPILMNTCARCHVSGRGGAFKLLRSFPGGGFNQRATQHNLAAVVAQFDLNHPTSSPLLIKAVSIHGSMRQAPIQGRNLPAFKHLENWVLTTLANNPHLREQSARAAVAKDPRDGKDPRDAVAPSADISSFRPAATIDLGEPAGQVISMTGAGTKLAPAAPTSRGPRLRAIAGSEAPPAVPADPFDPLLFNRQSHK
jgi:hypothetical protein